MLDIGWSEMMVILVVALIVIGPKDLPGVIRKVSHFLRKARSMASEFQSSLDEIGREQEFQELKEAANSIRSAKVEDALDHVDPTGSMKEMRETAESLRGEIGRPLDAAEDAGEAAAASGGETPSPVLPSTGGEVPVPVSSGADEAAMPPSASPPPELAERASGFSPPAP